MTLTLQTVTPVMTARPIAPVARGSRRTTNSPAWPGKEGVDPLRATWFLKASSLSAGVMIGESMPSASKRARS